MKIVPLFPKVQTRTLRLGADAPAGPARIEEPGTGDVIDLVPRSGHGSELSRDEAFILLGKTMTLLGRAESPDEVNELHRIKGNRAVGLLIHD
jgi:hypothetical protein